MVGTLTTANASRPAGASAPAPLGIYSVAADGSGRMNLSTDAAADMSPTVSPDGRQVAFVSDQVGPEALYVMGVDGSNRRRICPNPAGPPGPCTASSDPEQVLSLAWSPEGRTLGFSTISPSPNCFGAGVARNYVVDANGGEPRWLAYGFVGRVHFSPNGRFVAWETSGGCTGYRPEITIAKADSGDSTSREIGSLVGWSPRAQRLLSLAGKWDSGLEFSPARLIARDPFGGTAWTLARIPVRAPAWSPDGRQIAFFRGTGPGKGLYAIRVWQHRPKLLVRFGGPITVRFSAWSPSGAWIAFASGAAGLPGRTYFVRSDGRGLRRVAGSDSSPSARLAPVWSPDSRYFAFAGSSGVVRIVSPPATTAVPVTTAAGPARLGGASPLIWSADSRHLAFVDVAGVVQVASPTASAAVSVTSATTDLDVCRSVLAATVCQIAWAGDRLLFASRAPS